MTPQLQMAIRLLELSLPDLTQEIPKMLAQHPLLGVQQRTTRPIGPYPPDLDSMPEVYVYAHGGAMHVEANVNAMPEFSIGNTIVPLSVDPDREADETTDPIATLPERDREAGKSALFIARAFQQRARTYVKVIRHYVAIDPEYFSRDDAPAPKESVTDAATALETHASTIRSVLEGNKVLRCERGLVRLDTLLA